MYAKAADNKESKDGVVEEEMVRLDPRELAYSFSESLSIASTSLPALINGELPRGHIPL